MLSTEEVDGINARRNKVIEGALVLILARGHRGSQGGSPRQRIKKRGGQGGTGSFSLARGRGGGNPPGDRRREERRKHMRVRVIGRDRGFHFIEDLEETMLGSRCQRR